VDSDEYDENSDSNYQQEERHRSTEFELNGTTHKCKQVSEDELGRLIDTLVPVTATWH